MDVSGTMIRKRSKTRREREKVQASVIQSVNDSIDVKTSTYYIKTNAIQPPSRHPQFSAASR